MSSSIVAVFKRFCAESGFRFHPLGRSTFLGLYGGRRCIWPVFCEIDGAVLSCLSILPATVPAEKRADVLDYLNHANWRIKVGNLEMDPVKGQVQFRSSLDCADGKLTQAMVEALIFRNLITCERYLPGLLRILFADSSLADAFHANEASTDDEDDDEPDEEPDAADLLELLHDVDLDQSPDLGDD